MVQVLDAVPSFGSQIGRGLGRTVAGLGQGALEFAEQARENKQLKEKYGLDLEGLQDPQTRQSIISQQLQGRAKQQEQERPMQNALETVARMRQLKETGHLGPKISQNLFTGFANPEVRKNRAEYEQLGKSLIQYATNIPIRNKLEFETLAERIYDPTLTDAEIEGVLDAMERIIKGSMGQSGEMDHQRSESDEMRPSLSKFFR